MEGKKTHEAASILRVHRQGWRFIGHVSENASFVGTGMSNWPSSPEQLREWNARAVVETVVGMNDPVNNVPARESHTERNSARNVSLSSRPGLWIHGPT